MHFLYFSIFLFTFFSISSILCSNFARFKRDFMFVTDANLTDAQCFENCQTEFKTKFEYTFNQSLGDFYDFPFHPILLNYSTFQLYCTLSDKKTACFSEKCSDFTAENSFSPSNFICSFKRNLFEKSQNCLEKTEPITFLKCDQQCHEEIVNEEKNNENHQMSQVFVSSQLNNYEEKLNRLCKFQSCYAKCMNPIVHEMCKEEEAKDAIELVELYIQWHADDISDWHSITGNDQTLPKSCQELVKNHRKTNDPVLQLIADSK